MLWNWVFASLFQSQLKDLVHDKHYGALPQLEFCESSLVWPRGIKWTRKMWYCLPRTSTNHGPHCIGYQRGIENSIKAIQGSKANRYQYDHIKRISYVLESNITHCWRCASMLILQSLYIAAWSTHPYLHISPGKPHMNRLYGLRWKWDPNLPHGRLW